MKARNITDNYTAKSWKAGDKLLASDLTKMSTTLDAVENEVVDIETTALPTLTTRVAAAEAKIATLETADGVLDLPEGQTVTGYVDQKVADLVGSAPETLDTIAEVAAAIETNGDAIEAIQSLVTENGTAIDGVQTTVDELGARTETLEQTAVKFTEFQREQDETIRKTIQLDNFDSISGVTTTGAGVNLAMVSKWDKADFGSAQIPLNLNSKDGVVTINDGVVIATVDQIPSTEGFAMTTAVDEKLAGKQDAGDYPVYQKFSAGADPAERKTIQLANADSISGVSTSGGGANLIMMSKWDKVDIGSVNYQMNLNSPNGVVQINDEKVVATTDQIPDVTKFVTNEALQTAVDGKQDKGDYALKSEIPDVSDFVTTEKLTEQLTTKQDAGDYPVYQQFVAGASDKQRKTIQLANADSISGVMSTGTGVNLAMVSEWDKADFGSSQLPLNLNATDGIVTINDSKTVATVDQIPDVSEFATTSYVDSKVNSALEPLATKEAVAGLKVVDLGTFEKVENASYAAAADGVYNNKEAVVLTFDTAEGSGVIFNTMAAADSSAQRMYWNNQVLSRTVTDGSGTGWDVLSNFTELQNRAIKSTLFTLTTDADSETIKAAMTNENSKTITASDLDSCLKYGYTIRDYALQSGSIFVGWTGSAYTLTYIGFASPTSEPYVMSVVVNVTPQGEYSIVRNGTRGQILTSSNLASNKTFAAVADVAPVIVNINLRDSKLTTDVQEKETILGWFGVTTDVELKQLIASTRPMFVRYGISLSTNPHYYKMPIEYVAYESATQLKMVFSGLDTSNDQPVRYTIVANLDGTPIEERGNVSMVLEPIDTQADIANLATKQELSDGLAGKAEVIHTHAISDVTGLQDALDGKQDKGDYATNEVVQAEFESYDKTIKAYVEQQSMSKADQAEVDSLDSRIDVVESISGNVYAMQSQIAQLMNQVQQLKTPTVEPVEISAVQPSVDQADKDVSFNATVNGTVGTITAKSIQSTNASIQSGRLAATATNDVSIKNLSTTGDLAKSTANAGLSVNTDQYVTITGANWQQTGYNGIEVGLNSAPKSVLIDGVDFKAAMSNNAISIFSWQENAVITISNCHFADVSNPLRLSNRDNKPCTINIVNCTCDQWTAGEYAGFICMQDYTSSSAQTAQEANQFGKLTINFVNCSGPDGRIVGNAQQLAENHIIYVYTDQEGLIAFGDGSRYPTVTAQ